ncbi:ciliary microtubule-associated protein 2-like [Amyelois transitella]|uniref:ciliary microtubule-associated protein 2-like n=1 Tax=Amyelois transitella TaxID=680683 RepID=UPI00067B0C10|nr:ciliary microtubule-associated protein 2-like [Amyelois transitella]
MSKNPAPFGASVKRFGKITVHPNLDPSGLYTIRPPACDPCRYHPKPMHKIFEVNKNRKSEKDPWRYKIELEEWAQNLGYRNQKILSQRHWQLSLLGPAWHTVPDEIKYEPACKNVGFGRTPRTRPSKLRYPGPGTYYRAVPFKAPYGPHSLRPTFEREEPCRFKDTCPRWSLAPNRYNIIDKESIEQKPKKLVSRRGPYDLFTGRRDGTVKNHFNTSLKVSAATWPLALKGSFDTYKKSHFGSMNKTDRSKPYRGRNALVDISMCVKRPDEPGPAHLNIDKPKVFKQYKHGFNSSYDKGPGYQRVVVWPGVGRYNVKTLTCGIMGQGHKHVFLSKLGRTIGAVIPEPMNSF